MTTVGYIIIIIIIYVSQYAIKYHSVFNTLTIRIISLLQYHSVFKTAKLFDEIPDFLMSRLVRAKYQTTIERHPMFRSAEQVSGLQV